MIFCIFRAGFVYSLNVAADFADAIGESAGSAYRSKANEILESAKAHYGKFGDYIYNCDVRPEDGSTIHSIATFGNYWDFYKFVARKACGFENLVWTPV